MPPSEICLRWVAGRPLYQNTYRYQRGSGTRIYGLRLYATAPQYQPGRGPKRIPIKNAAVPKQKPASPKLNPFISPNVPKQDTHVSPNPPKENKYVSPNTTGQASTSPQHNPPIQRKSKVARSEPKSQGRGSRGYIVRIRAALIIFVGSTIAYSMVNFQQPLLVPSRHLLTCMPDDLPPPTHRRPIYPRS